jgi:hypothetical protein
MDKYIVSVKTDLNNNSCELDFLVWKMCTKVKLEIPTEILLLFQEVLSLLLFSIIL